MFFVFRFSTPYEGSHDWNDRRCDNLLSAGRAHQIVQGLAYHEHYPHEARLVRFRQGDTINTIQSIIVMACFLVTNSDFTAARTSRQNAIVKRLREDISKWTHPDFLATLLSKTSVE